MIRIDQYNWKNFCPLNENSCAWVWVKTIGTQSCFCSKAIKWSLARFKFNEVKIWENRFWMKITIRKLWNSFDSK